MKKVVVHAFGGVEQLKLESGPDPVPGAGEVLVAIRSIGMNHADLMARRGEYKISSGEPPFTPGLEAGGVIEAVADDVSSSQVGQRVILAPEAPRLGAGYGGTYRSHYCVRADWALPAPEAIADEQLGAIWLPYLTAWGCLVWKQNLQPGQVVALPAASSSVAIAASQVVKSLGGVTIGLTSSADKLDLLSDWPGAMFDHLVVTHEADRTMRPWHREIKQITDGRGVDVFFDPVAAGAYLDTEIRCLARGGCVWVYGLLGKPDTVNVTPLIRLQAAIRGWALGELVAAGQEQWMVGCQAILEKFASGQFVQHLGGTWPLDEVAAAQQEMEKGHHVGKLVLIP